MSWEPVGDGRKHAPWDHTAQAYRAYWQTVVDCSRRRLAADAAEPPFTPLPPPPPPRAFAAAPNCHLFALHLKPASSASDQALFCFLFAPSLARVAHDERLFRVARERISCPPSGNSDPRRWCPVEPARTGSRLYAALVLRLAFLASSLERSEELLRDYDAAGTRTPSREARRLVTRAHRALVEWRDAHMMLVVALDQLGHVPRDDAGELWRVLLERYAPDINMFFHAGELPALYPQLVATPFFSATLGARSGAADPIVNKFRKALVSVVLRATHRPLRCN